MNPFARTERLLGPAAMARLKAARVAVFGLGGVGGHAAEALARSGVGALELFDGDTVALTNLNRQLVATRDTLGMPKADALAARLKAIVPETEIVLDTSWSIDDNLLRNFLRECKNILKFSRLKAGCFDTLFYGFQEIRTEEDIDNMVFLGGVFSLRSDV